MYDLGYVLPHSLKFVFNQQVFMRKMFFIGSAIFLSMQSITAQTTVTLIQPYYNRNPISVAIIGGYNSSTALVRINNVKEPGQFHNGLGLGMMLKAQFDGPLYFSPYVEINQRGYAYTVKSNTNGVTKDQASINYFDIAPALSLDLNLKKGNTDSKIVLLFSPVFSYAISGTEKQTIGGVTYSSKMKFAIDGNYGIVDLGFNWSVAYRIKKMFAQLSYQLGVANIDNNAGTDGRNIQNRMLSLNLGYYLK
jgi:hypothetical protein